MKKILIGAIVVLCAALTSATDIYRFTDLDRARETTWAMLSWKTALEAYAVEHGKYPDVRSLEEARAAVQPRYILQAPMFDAWGHPFRFEADPAVGDRIISAGADGKFESETWSKEGRVSSFNDDAVVTGRGDWMFRFWDLRDKCSQ